MSGIPVVISNHGIPVRAVERGAPLMTVATNGSGIPIRISDRGTPFVVEGLVPPEDWDVQAGTSSVTIYSMPDVATPQVVAGESSVIVEGYI